MTTLRLLGSGSGHGACPAVYATDTSLIVQGDRIADGHAVAVPHQLLDWLEPGMTLPIEATEAPGMVLVPGQPVTTEVLQQLTLDDHETAIEVR
ncbi:hypothetical protein [Nocardia asteroides]|uniref:hypothetical protein n=1 Tax=Nocardia asteroides TaxID=1824 RepID=UPI001E548EF3|nr:hypothetical protein [Nocardia asteroides]UGT62864.1 hypothetical protein LTT61_05870 [Nocardia asteroides]